MGARAPRLRPRPPAGARHPDMPKRLENAFVLNCNISLEYEKSEASSLSCASSRSFLRGGAALCALCSGPRSTRRAGRGHRCGFVSFFPYISSSIRYSSPTGHSIRAYMSCFWCARAIFVPCAGGRGRRRCARCAPGLGAPAWLGCGCGASEPSAFD